MATPRTFTLTKARIDQVVLHPADANGVVAADIFYTLTTATGIHPIQDAILNTAMPANVQTQLVSLMALAVTAVNNKEGTS